jgi:predicted secreted protein
VGGTALDSTGTLLAQGTELTLTVPGAERATTSWRVSLPEGVGFTEARATADGVRISLVGHQVTLGRSRFER